MYLTAPKNNNKFEKKNNIPKNNTSICRFCLQIPRDSIILDNILNKVSYGVAPISINLSIQAWWISIATW